MADFESFCLLLWRTIVVLLHEKNDRFLHSCWDSTRLTDSNSIFFDGNARSRGAVVLIRHGNENQSVDWQTTMARLARWLRMTLWNEVSAIFFLATGDTVVLWLWNIISASMKHTWESLMSWCPWSQLRNSLSVWCPRRVVNNEILGRWGGPKFWQGAPKVKPSIRRIWSQEPIRWTHYYVQLKTMTIRKHIPDQKVNVDPSV